MLSSLPRRTVNLESFRRLHEGMTEQEVEAVLGGPAHHCAPVRLQTSTGSALELENANRAEWYGRKATITVTFLHGKSGFPSFLTGPNAHSGPALRARYLLQRARRRITRLAACL
jgi:hypothetical protein